MWDEILDRGYPSLGRALSRAASQADYGPEQQQAPEEQSDVPPYVADAVKAERERFAGFRPTPASTELGKDLQELANLSGRNADAMIRREAGEALSELSVDREKKPN